MKISRRKFLADTTKLASVAALSSATEPSDSSEIQNAQVKKLEPLREGWKNPPLDCRPVTSWWWPGNAVSQEGILAQLNAMKTAGLGRVEIVSSWRWYEKR